MKNPIEEGRFSEHGEGLGTVTEAMIRQRAAEIAAINGRNQNHVLTSDMEQARRELLGQELLNPVPSPEELLPENKRWDPIPGSPGRRAEAVPVADEQTVAEKLVEEGVAEAEHDQQVAASREQRDELD